MGLQIALNNDLTISSVLGITLRWSLHSNSDWLKQQYNALLLDMEQSRGSRKTGNVQRFISIPLFQRIMIECHLADVTTQSIWYAIWQVSKGDEMTHSHNSSQDVFEVINKLVLTPLMALGIFCCIYDQGRTKHAFNNYLL